MDRVSDPVAARTPTIVTLLVALSGPPLLAAAGQRRGDAHLSVPTVLLFQMAMWALAALVIFVVTRVEHRPLASIGLRRPRWATLVTGLALALVLLYLLPAVAAWMMNHLGLPGAERGVSQLRGIPRWALLLAAVTGGVVEETIYRGYAIERLAALTGRYWVAGILAALAFGLAHVPGWGAYAVVDFIFGLFATALYLWRRDLLANIIAHVTGLAVALTRLPGA